MEELEAIIGAPADHYTDDARAAATAEVEQRRLLISKDRVGSSRAPAHSHEMVRSKTVAVSNSHAHQMPAVKRDSRMTVTVASGILHLDSADSIRTAFRAGLIGGENVLHPDDGTKPLTVSQYLERSGDSELLIRAERAVSSEVAPAASPATNATPNAVALLAAAAMLIGFFLPWAQLFGFGASGYNLGQLGSYGNLAWITPIGAALVLLLNLTQTAGRPFQVLVGLTPWLGLLYGLIKLGDVLFQVLSIGAYVTLVAATLLIFVPSHTQAATRASSVAS
jgi:hypothetical protein